MVDIKYFRELCTREVSCGRKRGVRRLPSISKTELAKRLGVSVRTIYRWENEPETQPDNIKELLLDCLMEYERPLSPYKSRGRKEF